MNKRQFPARQRLHVIRASAGSGKTHRLTGEYLRLLFSAPNSHRHILAVTFTNKATDEMKSRIVKELHRLASGADSAYLEELMTGASSSANREDVCADIRAKARSALEAILHDYSSFTISTIDRFFQQTMRSFARESGLAGGYGIELDETSLLTRAIDLMLSELDRPENRSLSEWLLLFMQHNIEEGLSWKIDRQVLELAKQLFSETYKSFTDGELSILRDRSQLDAYRRMLVRIVQQYESEVKSVGVRALNVMRQHGLSYDDFKHKRNSGFLLFSKLAGGSVEKPSARLVALVDNVDLWYGDREKEAAIRSACAGGLNDCVREIIRLSGDDREYRTARHLLRNFHTLGILSDIKRRLQALQQENNTLFLSDTTELLNSIIAGADSPFIYEKTGTRVHHYMIDEFQDTSRMQWENFRPLIGESLAAGHLNLIVGDVKQSIYRFRNSDWRLLEEQVKVDFRADSIREHVLRDNWRSDARIVQFNNAFFSKAAANLQNDFNASVEESRRGEHNTQIVKAYADIQQQVPPKKADSGGQVRITFLREGATRGDDWKAEVLERLPREIDALLEQGFALRDIAIAVRWNHEAALVAETLLAYRERHPESPCRYDIISSEALLIGSAQSVKSLIALMRHFRNPKDDVRRMLAIYEFYRFRHRSSPGEALRICREEAPDGFPEEMKNLPGELASMPFYEMTEHFFALTAGALHAREIAYVQAFLDIVLKRRENAAADLNDFLDWWDESGHKKALFSPEGQDAIRLITVHKSKGLGFGAVIMPFVSWNMDHSTHHSDIIWCRPDVAPFDALGVAPLRYGKGLEETIFRESYLEEKRFACIDNLNLLYVAFTRPKHRLIVFAPLPKKPEVISDAACLLWRCVSSGEAASDAPSASGEHPVPLHEYFREGNVESVFEYGEPGTAATRRPEEAPPATDSGRTDKWQSIPFGDRLKLRLNSGDYFSDSGSRDYGRMMHAIVSSVKTLADIPQAVERRISGGELGEESREEIISRLTRILSLPEVSDWYSGRHTVLNETQLLLPDAGFSRPDRVMIGHGEVIVVDYKFGGVEDPEYVRQVQRYVRSIADMGYQNVKGFLFYVNLEKTVEVETTSSGSA
ncbi:MAG: UvrD-helicase domain-containing protein [Proteiniphilum sp.]|jgi:ATP-dependent exoDNAse (exonuclease V) beta subunit|nr:UvrD-helicase domain-containing protein [Proteiniphilum sp.]